MAKKASHILIFGLVLLTCFSCGIFKTNSKFQTSDSGLKFKFIEKYNGRIVPENGKLLSLRMNYGTEDTLFFDSNTLPEKTTKLQMQASAFPGDFYEMMQMMHLGDSVVFFLDAKSFYTKTLGNSKLPDYASDVDKMIFHVKIMKIQTEEEIEQEKEAIINEMKNGEPERIKQYLTENKIETQATRSGLYVVIEKEGSGPKPQKGDRVKLHYTGTLLNGTKFDSSVDRGQPFIFPIGKGNVIKGWDEGIAMLHVGSKAKLIIPSNLGYGDHDRGSIIKAYSTLIFDVELLDIIK